MVTWFITGAARGLGYEMALHALRAGANVVATARNTSAVEAAFAAAPGFSGRLLPVTLDVTDESQAVAGAEAAIARFGSIDVLVNNAGRGVLGAVEETSAAEVEAVFATNVFGLLNVTRAVLPHMRTTANEWPDYAATVGRIRQAVATGNGGQVNDPARGAAAIYAAVTAGQPPLRFPVGPDAVAMVEAKLTRVRDELEAWRPLASSTLFTAAAESESA
jgi:NAD(P)-dependent dehydrogenase (short-subunit alcohol dehydrogenase family)